VTLGKYELIFRATGTTLTGWWCHRAFNHSKWFQLAVAAYLFFVFACALLDTLLPDEEEDAAS